MKDSPLYYAAETLEKAEEVLKGALFNPDRKSDEFFSDSLGDDSVKINELLLEVMRIVYVHPKLAPAVFDEIKDRYLMAACEAYDNGVFV